MDADDARAAAIPEAERCEWCGGTGNELLVMYRRCPKCEGTGRADNGRTVDGS